MTEMEIQATIDLIKDALAERPSPNGHAYRSVLYGALDALEAELRFKRAHPGVKP